MLSVMTVVLPHHSKTSGNSDSGPPANLSTSASVGTPGKTGLRPVSGQQCGNCNKENAPKVSGPMRCPYLKGYSVEGCRQHPSDLTPRGQQSSRECESLREAACFWKEKYDRLYENQRRLQKINESLEEKLLHIVEKFEEEKSDLTRDVSDLTSRLVEARVTIAELEEENEQYRNDCNIAVRLLQCKPSSFVAHKFNSLPADFQAKVKRHLSRPTKEVRPSHLLLDQRPSDVRTIKVSVPAQPSANMVYSVNSQQPSPATTAEEITPDHVSAAIIAKVLEERSLERKSLKKARRGEGVHQRSTAVQTEPPRAGGTRCQCHQALKHRCLEAELLLLKGAKEQCLLSSTETAI